MRLSFCPPPVDAPSTVYIGNYPAKPTCLAKLMFFKKKQFPWLSTCGHPGNGYISAQILLEFKDRFKGAKSC